jgi:phosphate acetyltransferase
MKSFLQKLKNKAKKLNQRILFPETSDIRILKALEVIIKEKLCRPVLIGTKSKVAGLAKKHRIKLDLSTVEFIDAANPLLQQAFAEQLTDLRKAKGLTLNQAKKLLKDLNYFSVMLLYNDFVDGIVSGATSSTASTLRPAFQIINTQGKDRLASGCFMMIFPKKAYFFADCAVNVDPTAAELAQIAEDTANNAAFFGFTPKVAMLSFSTHGSSLHPNALKVAQAVKILAKKTPHLLVDGELQADAALVESVAHFKSPKSGGSRRAAHLAAKIKGNANVLIFPNLEAGNIGYKLVERLAHAEAIGTIVQGLQKPCNDLSRGCKPSDIIYLTAITAIQAAETIITARRGRDENDRSRIPHLSKSKSKK